MNILNDSDKKKLTSILLDFGESLLISGSDISRVENTIEHISKDYNIEKIEVYVTTSLIVLTIKDDDFVYTESRRIISKPDNNFQVIEDINSISRYLNNNVLSIEELKDRYQKVINKDNKAIKTIFGYILASFSFGLFFGSIYDALFAALFSIEIYYSKRLLSRYCSNHAFFMFLISFINGLLIMVVSNYFDFLDINNIMIGDIMLLIPGASITIAFQNTLIGDTTSGINQFIESLLWSLAIAAGYGLAILLVGVF